jgi:hypothetical protein
MKRKIEYRARKSEEWEDAVNELLQSRLDVSFFPKDGEIYIALGDPSYNSIIIKKDGTWHRA